MAQAGGCHGNRNTRPFSKWGQEGTGPAVCAGKQSWAGPASQAPLRLIFAGVIVPGFLLPWPLWGGRVGNRDSGKGLFVPGFLNKMPVTNQKAASEELQETLPTSQTVKGSSPWVEGEIAPCATRRVGWTLTFRPARYPFLFLLERTSGFPLRHPTSSFLGHVVQVEPPPAHERQGRAYDSGVAGESVVSSPQCPSYAAGSQDTGYAEAVNLDLPGHIFPNWMEKAPQKGGQWQRTVELRERESPDTITGSLIKLYLKMKLPVNVPNTCAYWLSIR